MSHPSCASRPLEDIDERGRTRSGHHTRTMATSAASSPPARPYAHVHTRTYHTPDYVCTYCRAGLPVPVTPHPTRSALWEPSLTLVLACHSWLVISSQQLSNILGFDARVGPNIFHSMVGNGRCCLSDSRYQELFVVPRVCGCILNSRHVAL